MKLLEEKILSEGELRPGGIVKVDGFLNHRIDVALLNELGREFHRLFGNDGVTKILTVESSGIGIACITAQYFGVSVVFAKKRQTSNLDSDVFKAEVKSYTHDTTYEIRVSKKYISPGDRVLIIDDFLAHGNALAGLIEITEGAGATVAGAGICVEKSFQRGGDMIRARGIKLCSLAVVGLDERGGMFFCG